MPEYEDRMAALEREKAELQARYEAAPASEVVGIVETSAACKRYAGPWQWTIRFHAWRIDGGPVHTAPLGQMLWVEREISDDERRRCDSMEGYPIVKVRAKLALYPGTELQCGELLEVPERHASDPELVALQAELLQPLVKEDPVLGVFRLHRKYGSFEGGASWNGRDIDLGLEGTTLEEAQRALQCARRFWQDRDALDQRMRQTAVEKLLTLKNEVWIDKPGGPQGFGGTVTAAEFAARMSPTSGQFAPDGSFQFYYDVGDLFGDHAVLVSGTLADGPTDAQIA